ncbi:MAG: type II secretion system protein N [Betaproteobacteria bacterium]
MRKIAWAVLAAVIVVATVAWRAPATLMAARIAHVTSGRVTLSEARGTIWHGQGVLAAGDARIPVDWHLHPVPLLRGEIAIDVTPGVIDATTPRGRVVVDAHGTRFGDFALSVPAAAVVNAFSQWPQLEAAGAIEITAERIDWRPPAGSGTMIAMWRDARIGLAGAEPLALGEISLTLSVAEGRLGGPLRNRGGDFSLDGELDVQPTGAGHLRAAVQARRPDDARLAALALLGRREANRVVIDWQWSGP